MGRFFFQTTLHGEATRLEVDLIDAAAAKRMAIRCVGEYLRDVSDPAVIDGYSLVVSDHSGNPIMQMAFATLSQRSMIQGWIAA